MNLLVAGGGAEVEVAAEGRAVEGGEELDAVVEAGVEVRRGAQAEARPR